VRSAQDVLEALAGQPGGPQLLRLCEQREDVALVGGAVRDLLLGGSPRELDVVVGADSASLARELADAIGARVTVHARFGTALVEWEAGRVDMAERRAESYPAPGALPEVRPGTTQEDLARRDFTVNAIAVGLAGAHRGEPHAVEHAHEDLAAGRLRVLHEESFVDDPTRLWRLARYRARLGFQPEGHTAELAAAAVAGGALDTVSRARVGAELRLALEEADAPGALEAIDALGLLAALHPGLRFDAPLARAALEVMHAGDSGGRRPPRTDLLLLATLLTSVLAHTPAGESGVYRLLNDLEFPAGDRDLAIYEAMSVGAAAERLAGADTPSRIYEAAAHMSPEGVALAGAWGRERRGEVPGERGGADAAAREWLSRLYGVNLSIGGEDLLAAGIPEGPEIRRRLDAALLAKLDGELDGEGPDAELTAALRALPSSSSSSPSSSSSSSSDASSRAGDAGDGAAA
jgi:tRNA nucleotidyltransferase (CCA-adding enzyme)